MEPFKSVTGPAVSLPEADIDTDIIFPARFLLVTEKRGLGAYAFHDRRGTPGFALDAPSANGARILVTGDNFGCGSSREQAPWALHDLGVRVLIGVSFGEIFQSNCLKNGMLPIRLPAPEVERLHAVARNGEPFTVDLEDQEIRLPLTGRFAFDIAPADRDALLNGWNEVTGIRAQYAEAIARFEAGQRSVAPWMWPA